MGQALPQEPAARLSLGVNTQTASRKGEYFWVELGADNSSSPVWLGVTNTAVLAGGRTNNSDLVRTNAGHLFLAQSPEAFTHDADGNLTTDGRWTYTWNGENRLIALETTSGAVAAGKPAQRLEFAYDHQGRRIQKKVYAWDTDHWSLTSDSRFLYDGWNLIGIFDALNSQPSTLNRSFTWGLDLSGSEQGAGGVGGLLLTTDHGRLTTGFACYDGNGNVMALVDAGTGMTTAQYEYGPFGEVLRATGPMAKANPFRFSTKYQDDETDLLYYGYRFLDTVIGNWICRDPFDERGGRNLYSLVNNSPPNWFDLLGLYTYLLFWGEEQGVPFEEAAKTKANEINNYIPKCDHVYVIKAWDFNTVQTALKKHKKIKGIYFYMHGSPGILHPGTSGTGPETNISKDGGPVTRLLQYIPPIYYVFQTTPPFLSS